MEEALIALEAALKGWGYVTAPPNATAKDGNTVSINSVIVNERWLSFGERVQTAQIPLNFSVVFTASSIRQGFGSMIATAKLVDTLRNYLNGMQDDAWREARVIGWDTADTAGNVVTFSIILELTIDVTE